MFNLLNEEANLSKGLNEAPIKDLKTGRPEKTVIKGCCVLWMYRRNMTCGSSQRFKLSCKLLRNL